MGAGWIAQGPDTPVPEGAAAADPWTPTGPDTASVPALVRPHQEADAHPVDTTRGLFTRVKETLFGHEPESPHAPDQHVTTGIVPSVASSLLSIPGEAARNFKEGVTEGPEWATLARSYPHLVGAQFGQLKAGYQEKVGASQQRSAEQTLAALNVLPQVAARFTDKNGIADTQAMAEDPNVKKVAIKLGLDPKVFAGSWTQYAGLSPEQQAQAMREAKATFDRGAANRSTGEKTRAQAWADARVWQPSDLKGGALTDPWSLKSLAFKTALAVPAMAATAAATAAGGAVAGPAGAVGAGTAVGTAMFAPMAYADAADRVDTHAHQFLERADDIDQNAPPGQQRALNPESQALRQQAADLLANRDKIASTAGFLNGLAANAGSIPVVGVLARTPAGKAVLDRLVGATLAQSVGGRVAGTAVAGGAGMIMQTALQKAVDAGIVHEQTSLKDALTDMAQAGVIGMILGAGTEAVAQASPRSFRERAAARQAAADASAEALKARYQGAGERMGAPPLKPGEDYPGYAWNAATGKYEPTAANPAGNATKPRLTGTTAPAAATEAPSPETKGPSGETPAAGASAAREAYQAKVSALNTAAAAAAKRSDVTLEPEEEGWSVHVKGQPVARFDTVEAAREAMAQARKVVGTAPAAPVTPAAATSQSPVSGALEREHEAARRDAEMGVEREPVPEPVPRRAAEHEGEIARRKADEATVLGQTIDRPAEPSPAQAEAGNYKKPTVEWHGLPIKVENVQGQYRGFTDAKGKPGTRLMRADYGYFPGTKGADEDGIDVMMGPHPESDKAFVIDQLDHTGKSFDEHKIQLGVRTADEARQQYLAHYPKGWKGLGGITELNPNQLKRWLQKGDLTQPIHPESVPVAKVVRGAGPNAQHDNILAYLARHPRGLDSEEAVSQGIDKADLALGAAHVGIKRAFRKGGMSFDEAAEHLAEAGYPVTDPQGHYSPNVLLDRLDDELRGRKHYSVHNQGELAQREQAPDWRTPLSDAELAKLSVEQAQTRLAALRQEQDRLEREIERAGLTEESTHETEEELDRIPFQRREGGQRDLFSDQVALQNEIKRHEAALDKKRNTGQDSVETGKADDLFSQARRQMDLPAIGEETTRYALREPRPSRTPPSNLRPAAGVQLDIFANADLPHPAVEAARLTQSVKLAHIGEFRSGISRVTKWEDAAHVLAPLRKYPQENMTALVLDTAGKPLAVIRHSIGKADEASVEPWSLAGSIVQVPGAAQVFFAHNHPSGFTGQSVADELITTRLHALLDGSGITPRGMIVIGPGSASASYFQPARGEQTAPITRARRTGAVPLQERRYARLARERPTLIGPTQAKAAVLASGARSGALLVDNRNKPGALVPMSPAEMMTLRTGFSTTGAARLLKAMAESNSKGVIAFGPLAAARNVAVFANASGGRALDAMHWDSDGDLVSGAESGHLPQGEAFLQRPLVGPDASRKPGSMAIADIRTAADKFLAGFSVKPDVVIAKDLAELQRDPVIGASLANEKDGEVVGFHHPLTKKVYLVADQLRGPHDVASTLAHEVITHFGLRAAFGDSRDARYQAILDGVRKAMPADFRRRGEAEFPGTFNPLNAHHRNRAAEEVLAYYGQRYAADQSVPAQVKRWLDKLLTLLRDWFRSAFGLPKQFDALFVKRTLADLESFLRKGARNAADRAAADEPAFAGPEDTFYSGLAKAVDAAKRDKGTGAEWEATLRNMPGVKAEELQWVGLKDWLQGRGRVSKVEVAEFVHAHRVQVGEVEHGEARFEPIIEKLGELGYQVHEDEATGEPYLMQKDADGTAREIPDGDVPEEVRDLLHQLRAGPLAPPKYPQHVTPGGENYRELLLTLPQQRPSPTYGHITVLPNGKFRVDAPSLQSSLHETRLSAYERTVDLGRKFAPPNPEDYHSSHWGEPNVLAHVRFDDRTGPNGERVLHLAEIQSDWHQAGRRQGYATPITEARKVEIHQKIAALQKELLDESGVPEHGVGSGWWHAQVVEINILKDELDKALHSGVPDAPFKTTWPELAMKRMLRYAAEHGYDALSWDTGDTQAERYNIQQVADQIMVQRLHGQYKMIAMKDNRTVTESEGLSEERLRDYLGKDLAQKAISELNAGKVMAEFRGEALKVGGAGMRAFYDDILPKTVGKLVKKWGSSVEPGFVRVPQTDEGNALSVHQVVITPQMRDSVMQGQPMFLKRRKGSTGNIPAAPKKGAYELARRAVAAIPASELNLSLRRIVDPAGVSEVAGSAALRLRESLGELAQMREEAIKTLEPFAKAFDLLGTQDRYDFIDDMEEGKPQRNAELQPAADVIRKLLDDWRDRIRGLGTGALENFIENYFPHIWQDDTQAKRWLGKVFGRRPLKGPASFLKERTIPKTRDGLEAGLKPISTNPLILSFAKLAEMMKFYSGVKFVQGLKDERLAVFKPSFKPMPDDWVKIEDAVGRVLQWSETEQGFIERGHYIMPADAGRIVNNHLSASALRNFLPAQVFRVVSNAANALQLGFSGFHLGFTTLDAVISRNAIGIERLLHGEPLRAARAFLEAATGPGAALANIARGHRLRQAYGNLPGATPDMQRIVEGLMAAGGRIKMDRYFQAAQGISPFKGVGFATLASDVKAALTQPSHKVAAATQVLMSFPQQYATRLWRDLEAMYHEMPALLIPIEVAGRVTRASTSIIMEHIVPLQKLGVFSDLASDHIRRNPLEDPVAFAGAMQKIWNSVDNRLGEMVYDNLFWNRTFKDVSHMMVRAVGWNLGTIRELGGAPVDVVKVLDYLARGAPAEIDTPSLSKTAQARLDYEAQKSTLQRIAEKVGHKIPYALALVGTTMLLGAILQVLFTGKGPEEIKDYFFPWTGRMTKYGTKERISLPSYMKDIYEYSTQPATTVINKANPIFGIIHAIYANEDFFGNAVRDPDASVWRQMIQGAQYAAHEVLPFSWQGTKQFAGAGAMDAKGQVLSTMPYFGLTPAPARVTSPEQMERYQLRETEKSYIRGLQRQLRAAQQKNDVAEVNRLRDEIRQSKLKERGTEREIREDKIKAREAADKISSLIEGRSREAAAAALAQAGLPAFAELWRSLPERPRPRVAQSLEEFA